MEDTSVDDFFCPNEACPDYRKKGEGNIRLKERYGKQNTALLRNTLWLLKKQKQRLSPAIISAGVPLKTRLHCSRIWKAGEIRAQSSR